MSSWRGAGLNTGTVFPKALIVAFAEGPLSIRDLEFLYVNYSNIAAGVLRRSLKGEHKEAAMKRGTSTIKYFYWSKGVMLAEGEKPKDLDKEKA